MAKKHDSKELCFSDDCAECTAFIADLKAGKVKQTHCEICFSLEDVTLFQAVDGVTRAVCNDCYETHCKQWNSMTVI